MKLLKEKLLNNHTFGRCKLKKGNRMKTNDMGKSCVVCRHSFVDKDDEWFCQLTDEPCKADVENDMYTTCEEFER